MTKFLVALHLQWDFIFYNAQVHCEARREGLRKPSAMPDNEDFEALRSFMIIEMNLMLDRPYDLWDNSLFVRLMNLIVFRVTLFNDSRSEEPARLTLRNGLMQAMVHGSIQN
ncbi:hypothetical protein RRG08_039622 [Elysia crispata]|uniref:Uncharacterized protein n=1 Tax=Elysia crispata TaxID=231223 RepID=A0AAE0Y9T3_9GAST|nr:hypothetical protein RRG08_039622 [Elysia crispata]